LEEKTAQLDTVEATITTLETKQKALPRAETPLEDKIRALFVPLGL
jgi:hypothetical protein